MTSFNHWRMCCGLLLLVVLAGCNAGSSLDGDTREPEQPPPTTESGIATRILDATKSDEWVYFNLADNAVVYPADASNSRDWDIAFQRFKIKINGGVSGNGGARVAVLKDTAFDAVASMPSGLLFHSDRALTELTDSELISLDAGQFFAVCAVGFTCIDASAGSVDRAHLNTGIAAYAMLTIGSGVMHSGNTRKPILGWYDYFMDEGHVLRPAGDTWIIKTVAGIDIKLDLQGYYGQGSSESGTIAFRYQSLTPGFTVPAAGAAQLKAVLDASALTGTVPLTVDFSARVTGGTAVRWFWDFGDGSTADIAAPSHAYAQAGTFIARLTVTDERGVSTSQSVPINTFAAGNRPPVANAGPDQVIALASGVAEVVLDGRASSDADGSIVGYRWAGSPKPNDEATPSVMLGIGRYTFTLTVADDHGAAASDTVEITVGDNLPTAVIAATPTSGGAPLNVQFDAAGSHDVDGTVVSYTWDFGDGTGSTGIAPSHEYTQPGHYIATLTVIDDSGKTASTSQTIDATLIVPVSADTYIYEFLGNQTPSNALLIWANNVPSHAARALMAFDSLDAQLPTLTSGGFVATLNLYIACQSGAGGGFVEGCVGDPRAASPDGKAAAITDIRLQLGPWAENSAANPALDWSAVIEGTKYASFSANASGYWVSVDVTGLVEFWRGAASTGHGIVLTQEAYNEVRNDDNFIATVGISSREAPAGERPYLEIRKTE